MNWIYNLTDHTADIAFDVEADSLNELFIASANALRELISDETNIEHCLDKSLVLQEDSLEILLVSFLSELNYLFQSANWVISSIQQIEIYEENNLWNLSANILGGYFNRDQIKLKSEIKAITYHQMNILKKSMKFSTRIIFDI